MGENTYFDFGTFKDFLVAKKAFKGRWGEPETEEDRSDWERADDSWEWPDVSADVEEDGEPPVVARDDEQKPSFGSMSSPGMDAAFGIWEKSIAKPKQAPRPFSGGNLREDANAILSSLLEEVEGECGDRAISLVSDLHGNQYTPSPEESFRYVASLAQDRKMLSRLVTHLRETGLLKVLTRELAKDPDAMSGFVDALGDPDQGPPMAGRIARAMYGQIQSRRHQGDSFIEAVSGPVWQDPGVGFDDSLGGPPSDDAVAALDKSAAPGEGDQPPVVDPAVPGGDTPGPIGGDALSDGGDGVMGDEPGAGGDEQPVDDDGLGYNLGGASDAATNLAQALRRYRPLSDIFKSLA